MPRLSNSNETVLKNQLVAISRQLLPNYDIFRVETQDTAIGIPDIVFNGDKTVTWMEVKWATPTFKSREIQRMTVLKLARSVQAWYTVFYEYNGVKRTYIVPPELIHDNLVRPQIYGVSSSWTLVSEGFDFRFISLQIKKRHYDYLRA